MSNTSTSTSMNLWVWNQATDVFKYDQLANNFSAIGDHDHTTGKGTQIPTGGIANTAITKDKLSTTVAGAIPTYETSLPSSPVDGQEIYYAADATNGNIWHLRYRSGSSSSYKWEYVGGAPYQLNETTPGTGVTISANDVYTTGSSALTYTVPLNGDYDITFGLWTNTSSTTGYTSIGGVAPGNDSNAIIIASADMYSTRVIRLTGRSAASTLSMYHRTGATGSATFKYRTMRITPVRVG